MPNKKIEEIDATIEKVMTQEEALAEIKRLQELNDRLEREKLDQANKIKTLVAQEAGWLIEVPNVTFKGVTCGIQFVNGQAFIPENREIPWFKREPMKESTLEKILPIDYNNDKNPYNARNKVERDRIREREKKTSAQIAVDTLVNDYKYSATYFDGEHLGEIKARMDARAREYAEAVKLQESIDNAKKIVMPGRLGG